MSLLPLRVKLQTQHCLVKDIVVHGARAGDTRFLGATMGHAGFATFGTEDFRDGGIYARTDFAMSGSAPGGTATWISFRGMPASNTTLGKARSMSALPTSSIST